jgi:hypothetical protein
VASPEELGGLKGKSVEALPGAIMEWMSQDGRILECEPGGILNINRYMKPSNSAVKVFRDFHLSAPAKVKIGAGFSDILKLFIDGEFIFQYENLFKGFKDIPSRGWVTPGHKNIELQLNDGDHKIEAEIKTKEPFGWGLSITLDGPHLTLHSLE